jgi:CheY-like chemotaxis protein
LAAAPAFTEREPCVGLSISRTVIVILPRIAASLPTRRAIVNLLILVVDDEPDVEMLFRQQFRRDIRAGRFAMKFALSGDIALQHIADAAGISIILILSDINMPGMTGLELLPKAKAARPDVPVIMITAYGDAETKRKALEGGAEALFTKPIDFGALRSEIDSRVERAA